MKKRDRTILFSICFFLFIVSGLSVVFYSLGYRLDYHKRKITQIGAFYFKVSPKSVQIYINDKPKKKTDVFFGGALIDNLFPKKYQVEIKKEGYFSWKKTLEVTEKQVTEAKSIVLIPQRPRFTILAKNVEDFFFSPDEKKVILKEQEEDGFSLSVFDLERNVKSHLIKEGNFPGKKAVLEDLKFSPDSKNIFLKVGLKEKKGYFLLNLEEPFNLFSLDFLEGDFKNFSFDPTDPQKIFFIKEMPKGKFSVLYQGELREKKISLFPITNLITYQVSNENIFWLSPDGHLLKSDLDGKNQQIISLEPLTLKQDVEYQLHLKLPIIFLKEGNTLYLFNQDLREFQKFFESLKDLSYSPDSKKMAYFSQSEIWILFLEKIDSQPQKERLEQLFLARFSEKIDRLFWYTSHYLIFNVGNIIKVSEIDERDRVNIYDLAEFEKPKIFWNKNFKKLFILSQGNLFSSEKLIP